MTRARSTLVKFGVFATVMVVATVALFMAFAEYRTGSVNKYTAVLENASRLKSGDSVRVAGVRVGTVNGVSLQDDRSVLVKFDADRDIRLTTGTKAAVRYLNLVGDRYLELIDAPSVDTQLAPAGSQIPKERTSGALDLDLLLGGLKPVVQGLNPEDVNALSRALVDILQGQGDTMTSLLSRTSSFSNNLADNNDVIQSLIDNLNTVVGTLSRDGDKFSGAIDRLEKLVTGLAQDRDTIGDAVTQLDNGTASIASLLSEARGPLAATITQLNRTATLLDNGKATLDAGLARSPGNYHKLARLGSYGSWIAYYLCGLTARVTDLQGRTAVFPWVKQEGGRCADI